MKILVRGTNWIGDAVMSIPALRELRRIFPDARITLHTRSLTEGLFTDADFIDEIVPFEKGRWVARDVIDNANFLRDDRYDLAVVMPNSFESALTTLLAGVPRRVGYNKDLRGLLLTDPVPVPEWKARRHEVYYYLHLIEQVEKRVLGRETVAMAIPEVTLDVSAERRTAAAAHLAELGVDNSRPVIALGVGSTNSNAKRWPGERYAQLADRLHDDLGAAVVLMGAGSEREIAESVSSLATRPVTDLTGETGLAEAAATLAGVDLLISNDMGLAHVAAAVGTKTITIFGPTDPKTTRPFSPDAVVARRDVECSPCMLRECPIDHRCMTGLSVDDIFEMARAALAAGKELESNDETETARSIS